MRPSIHHTLMRASSLLVLVALPSLAASQTTFTACRVPDVNAIYMINVAGGPTQCLDPSHVEFSWTDGGTLADGTVTTATLADGAVTLPKLGFDPATQAELDAHATSADHDGRYVTETELGTAGTINTATNPVDWSRLKGVPADLADGVDDNTTYTASQGLVLSGTDFHLLTSCAAGEVLAWSGSDWQCTSVGSGTVTSVDAGVGLTGGPITTSGTLAVDFAGTGAAGTAARSDHTHAATGTLATAVGDGALASAYGQLNTGVGGNALTSTTSGGSNTAVGSRSLQANVSGFDNTAVGVDALRDNTGGDNTAVGSGALRSNVGGTGNVAVGKSAMANFTSGSSNVAIGTFALNIADGGSGNIAIGTQAGANVTTGSGNILIGAQGLNGNNTIRIGELQTATYVAGIFGQTSASGVPVNVNSEGRLGTLTSSIRFKEDVEVLDHVSGRLLELRPVQFRYRPEYDDGGRTLQYGLIAEEVDEVFPELVVHDEEGRPQTVRYHFLSALLLNELQRQDAELRELRRTVDRLLEDRGLAADGDADDRGAADGGVPDRPAP